MRIPNGPRTGAITFNLLHHKGVALALTGAGCGSAWHTLPITIPAPLLLSTGIILYGHACLGGHLGFGLKYNGNFRHTHLGRIGKGRANGEH